MTSQRETSPTGRRQVALAVVAFAATLILLAGLVSVIGRSDPGTTSPPATPSQTAPARP